jgi:UDP-N-acetylglucosamine/UDP-N-acetylgalactosamine diphosphorylase
MTYEQAQRILKENGQEHLLQFWSQLDGVGRDGLLAQLAKLDFASIRRMQGMLTGGQGGAAGGATDIAPADVLRKGSYDAAAAAQAGEEAIRRGKVGVLLVAGGQGSRLGYEGPKGCYPVAPVTNATLFEIHSRKILGLQRKFGAKLPFYIMTSEANDDATRAFFRENWFFGLDSGDVRFFVQGMWPALWPDGRMVLESPGRLFLSPDGHGGILAALKDNGMLDDMERRGLETLFYFQVDNPLVDIADPVFIGLHRKHGAQISVKVCSKRNPDEGLGVVVKRGGRCAIVEYTELTPAQKNERLPNGELKFLFGSVAIHVFDMAFLRQEAEAALPLHVAHKKVSHCDESGHRVTPSKPNAYKFEKFIFDVIPDAGKVLNVEFAREDEFSPVKNATGDDSPDMARRDMTLKSVRWLKACGVSVPLDSAGQPACKVEIDPAFAVDAADLKGKLPAGFRVTGDLVLGK